MAEPSGAEARPPIRVTVKTPKDKEEIVICDRASVKEVVRAARLAEEGSAERGEAPRRRGGGRGGGGPAGSRRGGRGGAGLGASCEAAAASSARAADARPGLALWPALGAWRRAGRGHLAPGRGRTRGLRAACAPSAGRGFEGSRPDGLRVRCCAKGAGEGRPRVPPLLSILPFQIEVVTVGPRSLRDDVQ